MPSAEKLAEFVAWSRKNITGDEKGEAHIFLDRLFQAFGLPGVLEVGGHVEFRVRKAGEDGGGTAFADLVWKPVVLVEMKKRGTDLQRHFRQAFDYWVRLVPNRPRWVVLCNFDEFWVYDFETDVDTPKDKLPLADLPQRWGPLAFLAGQKPSFESDREAVTREAADRLAFVFNRLLWRGVERPAAQRFILQMLVALFAEDIGLLEKYFVTQLLEDCTTPADTYDLLGGLFEAMNTRASAAGGRFKGVAYFNGGLFAAPARLELQDTELVQLREAAKADWSKVQPEIFGTIFEHSVSNKQAAVDERRAFGMHFTRPSDIMKIVGPTLVQPWREQIEGAKTLARLHQLLDRLHHFRVLDPACGSGNFLYLAYRELKRLEARIYERIDAGFPSRAEPGQVRLSFLSAQNFFGLDINPLAVEIAKVAMMIARKLAIDELHIVEQPLPLDNLDQNFVAADALFTDWPKADVIIGNPPFVGSRYLAKSHGYDYVRKVYAAFPDVPKMADYCVYWFRKAQDHLPPCTVADPVAGRAGLVGTQNIRNNEARVGGLDHICASGTIVEAVDNQPWSGEANVHVSIVNWVKTQDAALLPKQRRLWFKVEFTAAQKKLRKRGAGPASKEYVLDFRDCPRISPALSDEIDLSEARVLVVNTEPKLVFTGQNPCHDGFKLTPDHAFKLLRMSLSDAASAGRKQRPVPPHPGPLPRGEGDTVAARPQTGRAGILAARDTILPLPAGEGRGEGEKRVMTSEAPSYRDVLFPYMTGLDLVTAGVPTRWIIDFGQRDMLEAMRYPAAFSPVKESVMQDVLAKAEKEKAATGKDSTRWTRMAERWWQFRDYMPGTMNTVLARSRYIVCPRVTKRPTFEFVSREIHPDGSLSVFGFDDDYSFGILQSSAHWQWFVAKCSKLTERFRYTADTVFDTFPWPQLEVAAGVLPAVKGGSLPPGPAAKAKRAGSSTADSAGLEATAPRQAGCLPPPAIARIRAVAEAGREVRRVRAAALRQLKGGLRVLYRTLELPGANPLKDAHAALDAAVLAAYGFDPEADLLAQLLALNLEVAARIERGESVTAPGLPPGFPAPEELVTEDCIQPA